MKRGAERQIQREDGEDPHAADAENGSDGQSGSEAEGRNIASRPIRGLPKKKTADSPSSSFAQTPSSTPFTFAGFGTPQASTPSVPSSSLFSGFGASSASNASAPTTSLSPAAAPFTFGTPTTNGKPKTETDSAEVDYFCTLRGLNISLRSQLTDALAKEIDKDPFADLSVVLKAVQTKYEGFREKAESKRKSSTNGTSSSSAPPNTATDTSNFAFSTPAPSAAAKTPSAPIPAAKPATPALSTTPSFSLPKPPANGGFSFAGSSFSTNSTSKTAPSSSLLPGQPTFTLPSTGFFSSFGKTDDDDDDDEEEVQSSGKNEAVTVSDEEKKIQSKETAPAPVSSSTFNPFAISASPAGPSPFGLSSTPFAFGSASASPTSPVANSTTNNAYRFSFGGSRSDDANKAKDQDTSATKAPSLFSSSPAKTPSIGSNFANTSGVKQAGAFSFGSGNINFGSSSSPSAFGGGIGSTGFTFGSSPTKDTSKKSDDPKDAA